MTPAVPVAILCGGKGTRMREGQASMPKPLVEIGGKPILWHVMALYAAQGLSQFLLLLGHGEDQVRTFVSKLSEDWAVSCLDTGLDTPTGGRVVRAAEQLRGGTFCLTYADGLADIDLGALLSFHRDHGRAATVTVARPLNPWGVARLGAGGRVEDFAEKPRLESWVNGGFLVLEPRALDWIGTDDALERRPLEALAASGELYAFRHEGFWDCMDTYKDTLVLNELWEAGVAPWRAIVDRAGPGTLSRAY